MRRRLSLAVLVCALSATGCDQGTSLTPTLPVPGPPTITETFTGTVNVQGVDSHNFIVRGAGAIAITLTAVGPPAVAVGLGLGVPSGISCVLTLGAGSTATTGPSTTPQINGTALLGTFCVAVYDVGNLTAPAAYTVTVNHS